MKHRNMTFWLFLFPTILILLNVIVVPLILGILYSVTDWGGFTFAGVRFVGLQNYFSVMQDGKFIGSLSRTFVFSFSMLILVNCLGLGLALIVTTHAKGNNLLRSVYFLPNLIGGLILGYIWYFVFSKLFVHIGEWLNAQNIIFNWLQDDRMAFVALIIVGAWQMMGYVMVIYIAGLTNIPTDVLEASRIDGASPVRQFFQIKCPLLMPSFTTCLFISLCNSFKQYDTNLSLTNGGPYDSTRLITMHIYQTAYKHGDYAEAQAASIIFFLILTIITLVQVWLTKRKEVEL